MNLTNYAALDVKITEYKKVSNQFSAGRARVFYEGPNPNRTIITPEVGKELIKTIPGTPIVGRYSDEEGDFQGHEFGQMAYGFVPLEPNPMKVEIIEDYYGFPVKKIYYEVDVIIWDGRFPEAQRILGEEKALSMELNPDTLEGEIELYEDKHYFKITNAEFFGITVLGDEHLPCFKDAKFLQLYSSMLSAYESLLKGQKTNRGGIEMPDVEEKVEDIKTEEIVETVEIVEDETTIENEGVSIEEEAVEEETVEETGEFETEETEEETTEENSTEDISDDEEEENEVAEPAPEFEADSQKNTEEQNIEEVEAGAEAEALKEQVADLTSKLEVYENATKAEIVARFSSKISDSEFMNEINSNLGNYSVEELKTALGTKLAEQVLAEEEANEEEANGIIYSFNGVATKETKTGWQELVRATKATNK